MVGPTHTRPRLGNSVGKRSKGWLCAQEAEARSIQTKERQRAIVWLADHNEGIERAESQAQEVLGDGRVKSFTALPNGVLMHTIRRGVLAAGAPMACVSRRGSASETPAARRNVRQESFIGNSVIVLGRGSTPQITTRERFRATTTRGETRLALTAGFGQTI